MGKYDNNTAVDDSSDGIEDLPDETLALRWTNDEGKPSCRCGCLEPRLGAGEFRQGHDARLKGKLNRAHVRGDHLLIFEGDTETWTTPWEYAETRKWERFLEKAGVTAERREHREIVRRSKMTVGQLAKADGAESSLSGLTMLKAASRVIKAVGLGKDSLGADYEDFLTGSNAEAIALGEHERVVDLIVKTEGGFFVGQTVGLERAGRMHPVEIVEIAGERARVRTVKISGDQEEWVVELTSLVKGVR